jgi:hypothetical protein
MPRYPLEFSLGGDGKMRSLDFDGHFLCKRQQFDDKLYGFQNYIILQNDQETRVLIPKGVLVSNTARVFITVDDCCNENNGYYTYLIDSRFGNLKATSVSSRVYLACIFAACGTRHSEKQFGLMGAEMAITLLRQCWVNRPLTEEEESNLNQLRKFCWHLPALHLLCHEMEFSSKQLQLLFTPSIKVSRSQLDSYHVAKYATRGELC